MEAASLFVHITAGSLAVVTGYIALFATKGAGLHRRSGTVFAYAMVVMGITATFVAVLRGRGSLAGGPLAAYFVITALTAVRPIHRRLDIAMLALVGAISALSYAAATSAILGGRSTVGDAPVGMVLFLATVTLLAAASDVRRLRGNTLVGPRRIARHLWRMCFALWIATGSFFLGQMDEFPAWLQKPALMAVPAMLPLVLLLYWLWRVRARGVLAGAVLRQSAVGESGARS